MEYNLDRYLEAQKHDYEIAKKELSNGVSYIVTTTPNEQNND